MRYSHSDIKYNIFEAGKSPLEIASSFRLDRVVKLLEKAQSPSDTTIGTPVIPVYLFLSLF